MDNRKMKIKTEIEDEKNFTHAKF